MTTPTLRDPNSCAAGHYLDWADRGVTSAWRYLAGLVLIVSVWAIGTLAAQTLALTTGIDLGANPATQLAYLTGTFALGAAALPGVVQWLHRRPGWSVAVPRPPGPVRDFSLGVGIALVSLVVVDVLACLVAPIHFTGTTWQTWLPLAAVAVVGFAVQTGFEELLFRGYLAQAARRLTRRPTIIIGAPTVLFALMHWGNLTAYGTNPIQLAPYLLLGAVLGWAAWRSGSLWLPYGLHWANNTYSLLLIGNPGDALPTGAPLSRELSGLSTTLLLLLATLQAGIQILLIRRARPLLRRRARYTPRSTRPRRWWVSTS